MLKEILSINFNEKQVNLYENHVEMLEKKHFETEIECFFEKK